MIPFPKKCDYLKLVYFGRNVHPKGPLWSIHFITVKENLLRNFLEVEEVSPPSNALRRERPPTARRRKMTLTPEKQKFRRHLDLSPRTLIPFNLIVF